jgi:hypothetical protein
LPALGWGPRIWSAHTLTTLFIEADVTVAAGVIAELLAGQAGDQPCPDIEGCFVAQAGPYEDRAGAIEDLRRRRCDAPRPRGT